MNSPTDRESRQRGLTAIEAVLSLAVMGTLVVGFGTMLSNSRTNLRLAGAASELQTLRSAGDRYVQDNFASLVTSAASGPVSVPIATLVSQNYLPPGFPTSNAYGQTYQFYVRERSPTVLESLALTTGGTPLSASDGGRIALLLKTAGGYTPVGSSTINGTNGGWSAPLATYIPTAAPQPSGTPAAYSISYVSYGPGGGSNNALIRTSTGNPVDNQMSTAIDMQNNNINNGGTFTAATFNGTTGNITTANLQHANLPSGGTINFGSSYIYGDSTNTAFRQNGGFYVQDTAGNTKSVTDSNGNVSANGFYGNYVHSNGNSDAAGDMNSNRVLSNWVHSNGDVVGEGNGYFNGGNLRVGNGGVGYLRMYGTTLYDGGDNFHISSGLTTLDNGGLRFNDGTQQWTAGASPLNWDGGGGWWCNNNQHVNGYHYECGCSNNATWFACAPN